MTKNRLDLAISCWGLLCAVTLALIAPRFKRRTMFLVSIVAVYSWVEILKNAMSQTCTVAILFVLVGWTFATAEFAKTQHHAWAVTVLVFVALNLASLLVYTYRDL